MATALSAPPRTDPTRCEYDGFLIEFVLVTPAIAERWLATNDHNRSLNRDQVTRLAQDMLDGHWMFDSTTIKFGDDGRLLDGQHRLNAIVKSEIPQLMLVARGIVPRTQDVMDTGRKRTAGDMYKINGRPNPNVLASTAKMVRLWKAGAIKHFESKLSGSHSNAAVKEVERSEPRIEWAVDLACSTGKPIPCTSTTLAFTIWLLSGVDRDAAVEFFDSLANLRTNGQGDPRVTLLRRLQDTSYERKNNVKEAFFIVRAWNAWRKNETLVKIPGMSREGPIPFPIPI
jgi:hypothetical protein